MFFLRQENERVCRNLPTHPRVSLSCIQRAGGAHKRNQRRSERGACASPARTEARRADRGERWRCNAGRGAGDMAAAAVATYMRRATVMRDG